MGTGRKSRRAGGDIPRPRRALKIVSATTVALALAAALGGPVGARDELHAGSVGRMLGAPASEPRMLPVLAPARVAKVAVVPGSPDVEAWAFGHTHARRDGWAQSDPNGQGVFLRYTRTTGWRFWGPLQFGDGRPANPGVANFALAPNGEGWGTGFTGLLFHRLPGGPWRIDDTASAVSRADLFGISLKQDARGLYGWAVGTGSTFLKLDGGRWLLDNAGGIGTGAELLGNVVAVAAVDRVNAWAVASGARELAIYRRTEQGWSRFLTGKTLYDSAPSAQSGGSGGTPVVNQYASGAAVSAAGGAVWISGAIQPVDAQKYASQRGPGTDPTRPFVLRIDAAGAVRDYCPPIYQLSSSGVERTSTLCDESFPLATGALHGLQAFPNGEVVAGGYGFFRFRDGRWGREANVAGIIASGAFHTPSEGWLSSYGNRSGEGLASSTSITVGHWTRDPETASMLRRWPHPSRETLESVALEPGGGSALAVGGAGTIVHLEPEAGWDVVASPTTKTLHGVAWPARDLAFAVGEGGTVLRYDGSAWRSDPGSSLTKNALYGVAFASRDRGYAVGAKGTILAWDGARWRLDLQSGTVTDRRLGAIDFAGRDAIAVGDRSAIVVNGGSRWTLQADAPARFATGQEGLPPNLMSVTGLPDGRAFAGGGMSLLIERAPGRPFDRSTLPILSGSVHSLEATRDANGKLRILAAVGASSSRYSGSGLIEPQGWLYESDGAGWYGAADSRVASTGPDQDAPIRRDAVYGLAAGGDGRGFAVGGFPADLLDDDGHLNAAPSASVWRLSVHGHPEAPPGFETMPISSPDGTVSFAFVTDSSCADSICSAAAGSGTRGDELLTAALSTIAGEAAAGRIAFAAFGGNMRRIGIPEELAPVERALERSGVPAFAALGKQDLFGGVAAGQEEVLASNGYYLKQFASQPRPWGWSKPRQGFIPVDVAGEQQATPGQALTRYAFDYAPAGRPMLRMIFLDTSRTPLATSPQNPPGDQSAFLQTALAGARSAGIPAIVVMHQPLVLPVSALPDASALTTTLTAGGAAAVLAGHERVNRLLVAPQAGAPGAFPVAIGGSAGSPLAGGSRPERGAYHAWLLVTVPTAGAAPAVVSVRAIPILESVALSSPDGRRVGAGKTLHFRALGRLPDVGPGHVSGRGGDPSQARAATIRFPFLRACGLLENPDNGCVPSDVLRPDHRFACEDPRVCMFVREDSARPGIPARDDDGNLVEDAQSGMLCAFEPGRTHVRVEAGTVAARVPIEVGGGEGPCIPRKVSAPPVVTAPERTGPQPARPILEDKSVPVQILKPRVPELAVVAAVAPPPVNPAPAPPGGGAPKYEEEREAATEQAEMTALPVRKHSAAGQAGLGVVAGLAAVLGAILLAGRPTPKPVKGLAYAGRAPADVPGIDSMRGHRTERVLPGARRKPR